MATDLTVANEIRRQLGGKRFSLLTGAKNFVGSEDTLSFDLPRALKKIKKVRITLNGKDLYDIEYGYIDRKTFDWVVVQKNDDVYADMLTEQFELTTGLLTHF